MLGLDASRGVTAREANEWFQLSGIHVDGESATVRSRLGALLWNVSGGLLAGAVVGFHDHLLIMEAGLAFFMPVTLALSESIGMQAVAISITGGRSAPEWRAAPVLAGTCALLVGLAAIATKQRDAVAVTIVAAIVVAMTASALIGALVPALMRRFSRNPAVAAGPIVLAVADFVSLMLYFRLGAALLS